MNGNKTRHICMIWMAAIIISVSAAVGCEPVSERNDDSRISIVCTTFPQYDWIKNLVSGNEDKYELLLLTDKGQDLHSYQPSAIDIAKISECDMLVYVGGESDAWVEDVLRNDTGTNFQAVNMMDVTGSTLYEEEHYEHDHHNVRHHNDEHDAAEYDEHIWLSLKNAECIVNALCDELIELDAVNAELYTKNRNEYMESLDMLDKEYEAAVDEASGKTLVFADRFPFRYMAQDYGIECFAAFEGCSAETEASFETVSFLTETVKEHSINFVLVLEGSDTRLAQVVAENSGRKNIKILVMDSMQSVSKKDIENGISYLSVMADNLDVLRQALR